LDAAQDPVGSVTVDGTGRTLLPGLIDAHVMCSSPMIWRRPWRPA